MAQYKIFRQDGSAMVVEADTHLDALRDLYRSRSDLKITEVEGKDANHFVQGPRAVKTYKVEKILTLDEQIERDSAILMKMARELYLKVEKKYLPDDVYGLDNCGDYQLFMWFEALLETIGLQTGIKMLTIKKYIADLILAQKKIDAKVLYAYVDRNVDFDKIQQSVDIRSDFATALKKVKRGTDLSDILGYAFSDTDIKHLAELHKANKYRSKIESLLEDCNFHTECGDFAEHDYDKYLKY